jgi:N-methylhydantoinase B/oxoprolinase/acetone carboxylase alpha subunit
MQRWLKQNVLEITKQFIAPINTIFAHPKVAAARNQTTLAGQLIRSMPTAPVTKTTSVTLTAAEVLSGILLANQGAAGAATYTMPTGTLLQAQINAQMPGFAIGDTFELSIVNVSTVAAEDVTIAGGVGTTAAGNMTIPSNAAVGDAAYATFRFRKTADVAFTFYRIG